MNGWMDIFFLRSDKCAAAAARAAPFLFNTIDSNH